MAGRDTLYRLIRSLNQSEKGYFKKHASLYSGERNNNYIRLFEAIDKQKEYDEQQLKAQFSGERFINNFSAAKNYLSDAILRSLKAFHGGKTRLQKAKGQISDAKMLFKKGFFLESDKLLQKAYATAEQSEEFILMQEILAERIVIVLQNPKVRNIDNVSALINQQEAVAKIFSNSNQIALLYYEVFKMRIEATDLKYMDIDRAEQIMNHPLLRSDDRALSLKAKSHFYLIHQFFAEMKGDKLASREFAFKYLNLLQNNPKFTKRRDTQNIIFAIYNYLGRCRETNYYQDIDLLLDELKAIKPEYLALKIFHFELLSEVTLATIIHKREFKEVDQKIDSILVELEKRKERIRSYCQQRVYQYVTIIRIIQGRFKEALDMNLATLEASQLPGTRGDMELAAKILNLILHLELSNHLLVPNLIRSIAYQIKKQSYSLMLEKQLLHSINKLAQSPENQTQDLLVNFLQEVQQLEREKEIITPMVEHLDLTVWIQSRIEKTTMLAIYNRRKAESQSSKA